MLVFEQEQMYPEAPAIESGEISRLRKFGSEELSRQFSRAESGLARMIQIRLPSGLRSRIEASDVLQDAFIEAARRLSDYLISPRVSPYIWLRQVTRQLLAQHYRLHVEGSEHSASTETRMDFLPGIDSMVDGIAESVLSPLSAAEQAEVQRTVQQLLSSMDPLDREVLCMKQLERLSYPEVAEELQIDISTAKRRFQRAAIHMRRISAHLTSYSNS
jgi:RNA polymerase sigma-70 factor (ECF subfamily)